MRTLLTITILLLCVTSAIAFNPQTEPIIIKGNNLTESMTQKVAVDMMNIFTDPKGIWLMQGDGVTLDDAFSTAHSGTLTGGITFPTDRTANGFGHSLLFNGTTDYIDLGDSDDFSFGNGSTDSAFTVCALVNVTGVASKAIVAKYKSQTNEREWIFEIDSSNKLKLYLFDQSAGSASETRVSASAISNEYHFIVATYDGGGGTTASDNIVLYIDGIVVSSTSSDSGTYTAMENFTNSLRIGSYVGITGGIVNPFDSNISFVALEKSELTAAQVYQLWKTVQGVYGL